MDRRDTRQAARWLGEAIAHADTLKERTHAPMDASHLDVLWFVAQLHADGSMQVPFDVPRRLGQAHRTLIDQRQSSFEIYLALCANTPAEVREALLVPAQH